MCKVADKIKFCTCKVNSVENLKHYWVYHTFDKDKNDMVIGCPVLPYSLDIEADLHNRALLLERVNDPDAFDKALNPKNKDRLQLSFTCGKGYGNFVHYGYKYKRGKWIEVDFDGLMWMWHHDESDFGEIRPAIDEQTL